MIRKFLIAALATAATVPLLAQTAPVAPAAPVVRVAPVSPPRMRMMMADKVMTRAEVQAMVQTHFARIDTNHDGFIAGDEMTMRHPGGAWQGENSNRREMREGPMGDPNAAFDRLDANKDGMISRDEFAKGRELRIEQRVVMNGDGNMPMGQGMRRMHGMGGMGSMMGGGMLKMADANKDGRVSLKEATSTALQHFDRADTNHDGRLTPDEMRAAHQMMRQKHQAG